MFCLSSVFSLLLFMCLVLEKSSACGLCSDDGLPAWYSATRVQAHTRLAPPKAYCSKANNGSWSCDDVFTHAGQRLASIGVKAFTRHTHQGSDKTYWQSGPRESWEELVQDTGRNLAQEMIDDAHANGARMIAYHYTRCHAYWSEAEPEWVNKDFWGRPQIAPRGPQLCINSPWRQVYLSQLRELVDMGVDGFYFDEYPQPPGGCWCKYCQAEYVKWSGGKPLPNPNNTAAYRDMLLFNTANVNDYFKDVAETVANQSKVAIQNGSRTEMAVSLVSVHSLPCGDNGGELFETGEIATHTSQTCAKIEYDTGYGKNCNAPFSTHAYENDTFGDDTLITWGWIYGRDISYGRPAHTWQPLTDTEPEIYAGGAALASYGLIANIDNSESKIPDPGLYDRVYKNFSARITQPLNGTFPRHWAGVLFNTQARDGYLPQNDTEAWTHVVAPTLGAWQTLLVNGVSGGAIMDWQLDDQNLEYLTQFAVIIKPAAPLTAAQEKLLAKLISTTRIKVVNMAGSGAVWMHKANRPLLERSLWANITAAAGRPPVQLEGLTTPPNPTVAAQAHAVPLAVPRQCREQVVMVTNSFTWAGKRNPNKTEPVEARGLSLSLQLAPGAGTADIQAYDVANNLALDITASADDRAVIKLPAFEAARAIHFTCTRPGDASCCF